MAGSTLLTGLGVALVAETILAGQPPGTLNFRNVTGARIVSMTVEITGNEKFGDFGDFDNDNDLDVLIGNSFGDFGARRNKLYRNDGGTFIEITETPVYPDVVLNRVTKAAFLRDFTGDGWPDIIVVNDSNTSPSEMYLNVQIDGVFSHFADLAQTRFPGAGGAANHAASADFDGVNGPDLLFANAPNNSQDRLWLNDGTGFFLDVTGTQLPAGFETTMDVTVGDLNGVIPDLFNQSPAAIEGFTGEGESDTFTIENLGAAAFLSVVLNGVEDYLLEILDGNDVVQATIDRGGVGTEEAVQYAPPIMPSTVKVRVTTLECANGFSVVGECSVGILDFLELLSAWGPNPGHRADFDLDGVVGILDFLALLANWAPDPPEYVLEVLTRDG